MEVLFAFLTIIGIGVTLEALGVFGRAHAGGQTLSHSVVSSVVTPRRVHPMSGPALDTESKAIIGSVMDQLGRSESTTAATDNSPRHSRQTTGVVHRDENGSSIRIDLGRFDGNPNARPFLVKGFNTNRDRILLVAPNDAVVEDLTLNDLGDKTVALCLRGCTVIRFERLKGASPIDTVLVED